MRILILPLVILSLTISKSGLAQTCASPYDLPTTNNICSTYNANGGTGNPVCTGTNARRVTWFRFTAASTCPIFNFSVSLTGVASDVSLYTTCGGAEITASRLCMANGSGLWSPASPLSIGTVYYLRVYTNTTATNSTITVCTFDISTAPQVTLNSPCQNFPLTPVTPASLAGNSPGCSYASNDADRSVAWLKFHPSSATACVNFGISTNSGTANVNTEVSLYTGPCGGSFQAAQNMCLGDGTGIWSPGPGFTWPNWSASAVYYLRIYTATPFSLPPGGTKEITVCGTETAPVNDDCVNATRLDGGLKRDNIACDKGGNSEIIYSGSTTSGTSATANAGWVCAGVLHNTAWYKVIIENGTIPTTIRVRDIDCDLYSSNSSEGAGVGQIQIGLMTATGTGGLCTSLASGGNLTIKKAASSGNPTASQTGAPNCWQGNATSHDMIVPGGVYPNGTTVYMAIDGWNGANCKYGLTVVDNAIPIPVKLEKFLVFKAVKSNLVMWTTASELNNSYFEVERSVDGVIFQPIAKIQGAGNSTWDVHYKFEDKNPLSVGYYRLKQVDVDGKPDYSTIAKIVRDNFENAFNVSFANPVQGTSTINIMSGKSETVTLQVVDVVGRSYSTQIVDCNTGYNTIPKDFSRLPSGTYYLVATQGVNRVVKLFIKQ